MSVKAFTLKMKNKGWEYIEHPGEPLTKDNVIGFLENIGRILRRIDKDPRNKLPEWYILPNTIASIISNT